MVFQDEGTKIGDAASLIVRDNNHAIMDIARDRDGDSDCVLLFERVHELVVSWVCCSSRTTVGCLIERQCHG